MKKINVNNSDGVGITNENGRAQGDQQARILLRRVLTKDKGHVNNSDGVGITNENGRAQGDQQARILLRRVLTKDKGRAMLIESRS